MSDAWPALPYEEWTPTKETLHRYAQLVGKIRMALTPPLNHWWHVTLKVTTRGLSTGPMPHGDGYVEIARRSAYYRDGSDAVVMQRLLAPGAVEVAR